MAPRVEPKWLFPLLCTVSFFQNSIFGTFTALIPGLLQNYVVSGKLGTSVNCALRQPQYVSQCADALSASNSASTLANTSYLVLTFLLSPLVGTLTDCYGRRTLYRVGALLAFLPGASLALVVMKPAITPIPYLIAHGAQGLVSQGTITMAMVSDWSPNESKTTRFGALLASVALAYVVAPFSILILPTSGVALLTGGLCLCGFLLSFLVPESLPLEDRAAMDRSLLNPFVQLKSLGHGALQRRLTACACAALFNVAGLAAPSIFYFKLPSTYYLSLAGLATLMPVVGISGVFTQGLLLRPLVAYMQERRVLVLFLVLALARNLLFAFGPSHTLVVVYVTGLLYGAGLTAYPITLSTLSTYTAEDEQGTVQGAAAAARSLSEVVGTLVYGQLLSAFTSPAARSGGYFQPRVLFYLSTVVAIIALGIALSLPRNPAESTLFYERAYMARKQQKRDARRAARRRAESSQTPPLPLEGVAGEGRAANPVSIKADLGAPLLLPQGQGTAAAAAAAGGGGAVAQGRSLPQPLHIVIGEVSMPLDLSLPPANPSTRRSLARQDSYDAAAEFWAPPPQYRRKRAHTM